MTSRYVITEHAASTGGSMTRFVSRSWQPSFANSKRCLRHCAQLTTPQWGVTKAEGLSNTLRVQKVNGRKKAIPWHILLGIIYFCWNEQKKKDWERRLPGRCQHTILPNFPQNCMKLKEFGPLRSVTGLDNAQRSAPFKAVRIHDIYVHVRLMHPACLDQALCHIDPPLV